MAQIFSRRATTLARVALVIIALTPFLLFGLAMTYVRTPYLTGAEQPPPQPVPFSHQHHVGGLGIGCRYCHAGFERSAFAGLPATEVCMTCHSELWTDAEMLAPVRESLRSGTPLRWRRVHDLPDFVYFNHSVHVRNGIGCVSCHGRMDRMPLTWKTASLQMRWCLDCHRDPLPHLRPPEAIDELDWEPPPDRKALSLALAERYQLNAEGLAAERLTDCSICHR